ncbi:hypothetical protein [Pseudomonas sp. 2023EL-01195]|uniref:hypothetical protein n=1 Tax=Pseudomonas sp. 2023EL-01195 TaxID=3088134 RepID=UPI00296AD605|nr:hypothetical protein [Pseudomonas sp. 2023EL-01195]MDW3711875.1 hypothetical protein [Pseudomonas sp. 2023EL-01195]
MKFNLDVDQSQREANQFYRDWRKLLEQLGYLAKDWETCTRHIHTAGEAVKLVQHDSEQWIIDGSICSKRFRVYASPLAVKIDGKQTLWAELIVSLAKPSGDEYVEIDRFLYDKEGSTYSSSSHDLTLSGDVPSSSWIILLGILKEVLEHKA